MEGDIKVISASFAVFYEDCMQKREQDKNQSNILKSSVRLYKTGGKWKNMIEVLL